MSRRVVATATACAALLMAGAAHATELPLPKNGWASWEVEAVEDAPAFCCWKSWDVRVAETTACDLDGSEHGYGTREKSKTRQVRVYARFANGKVERLRTLSASCPVKANAPIQPLAPVATDDSARWLVQLERDDLKEDVLASLAVHRGDLAFNALKNTARTDKDFESRQHAVFWIALVRGLPGAEFATTTMFSDKNADMRQHASFAVSQSKSPHVARDLTKLGNTDVDGEVRAQAWFWLAHSGAPGAEGAIAAALRKDQDDNVREQAIAALAQLPDDRATKALIATTEDRSLSREQRKRALFWLAQSDSTAALAYLDRVLLGNHAR